MESVGDSIGSSKPFHPPRKCVSMQSRLLVEELLDTVREAAGLILLNFSTAW